MELYLDNYKGFVDTLIPIRNVFLRNRQSVSHFFPQTAFEKWHNRK